ncbi:MAG: hypothetical protein HQK51_20565 [Oligoflexia bacterium]|nr:hypothetical protein [Oligoflexia bacterium]
MSKIFKFANLKRNCLVASVLSCIIPLSVSADLQVHWSPYNKMLKSNSSSRKMLLGESYDDKKFTSLQGSCVAFAESSPIFIPPQKGEFTATYGSDFDSIYKTLAGNAKVELNMSGVNINGAIDIANESAKSNYKTNIMISYNLDDGYYQLDLKKVTLAPFITNPTLGLNSSKLEKICGTRFLSSLKLGANFAAIMTFEFKSESAKKSFEGKLQVDLDSFKGEGQLQIKEGIAKAASSIKVILVQNGGDPKQFSNLVAENDQTSSGCDLTLINSTEENISLIPPSNLPALVKTDKGIYSVVNRNGIIDKKKLSNIESNDKLLALSYNNGLKQHFNEETCSYITAKGGHLLSTPPGTHILDCNINNMNACLASMKRAFNYALRDFPAQFENNGVGSNSDNSDKRWMNYIVTGRTYASYEQVDPSWLGDVPNPLMIDAIVGMKDTAGRMYLEEDRSKMRAEVVLKNHTNLSVDERTELINIQGIIDERKMAIAKGMQKCKIEDLLSDKDVDICENALKGVKDQLKLIEGKKLYYNSNLFTIEPKGFYDWCVELKSWRDLMDANDETNANLILNPTNLDELITILNKGVDTFNKNHPDDNFEFIQPQTWPNDTSKKQLKHISSFDKEIKENINCSTAAFIFEKQKSINLSDSRIAYGYPLNIFKFITELDLSKNTLTTLKGVARLKTLRTLMLSELGMAPDNDKDNPYDALKSTSIATLNLSNNPTIGPDGSAGGYNIFEGISGMKNLRTLILDDNPISTFKKLTNLGSLQKISLKTSLSNKENIPMFTNASIIEFAEMKSKKFELLRNVVLNSITGYTDIVCDAIGNKLDSTVIKYNIACERQ